VVGGLFSFVIVPETRGRPLEEIDAADLAILPAAAAGE